MARVPAFQAGYAGSIPVTRSNNYRSLSGFITCSTNRMTGSVERG